MTVHYLSLQAGRSSADILNFVRQCMGVVVFGLEVTLPEQEEEGNKLIDMAKTFATFTKDERVAAYKEVEELLADDPDALIEWERVKEHIETLEVEPEPAVEVISLTADEVSEATGIALDMVSSSNWNHIVERKDQILESLISKKKISAEDAALYTADPDAWVTELKTIWDLLQLQAEQQKKTKGEL